VAHYRTKTTLTLKKCPWCGRQPLVFARTQKKQERYYLKCRNEYCRVNPNVGDEYSLYDTMEELVEVWNTRHPFFEVAQNRTSTDRERDEIFAICETLESAYNDRDPESFGYAIIALQKQAGA
jgi:hypothetical protein